MKKKVLVLVAVTAMLALPMTQSVAAQKPTPPSGGGAMGMASGSTVAPKMSGYDMMKMRVMPSMALEMMVK